MESQVKKVEKRRDGAVTSMLEDLEQGAVDAKEDVALWIREHRVTAVASGLTAGILLGMLIRR